MISFTQLVGCFLVGLISVFGLGPIFVLTFNRSALYGIWQGFATAFGAAIGDGILFSFALGGLLQLINDVPVALLFFDVIGALFVIYLGQSLFRFVPKRPDVEVDVAEKLYKIVLQSLFITLFNPAAIAYFTLSAFKVFPQGHIKTDLFLAAVFVFFGTMVGLSVVVVIAHQFGVRISKALLSRIGKGSGLIFMIFGTYLLYDFYKGISKFF